MHNRDWFIALVKLIYEIKSHVTQLKEEFKDHRSQVNKQLDHDL